MEYGTYGLCLIGDNEETQVRSGSKKARPSERLDQSSFLKTNFCSEKLGVFVFQSEITALSAMTIKNCGR